MVAVSFSLLKWYGYKERFIVELWRRSPKLRIEDGVYLEDGRGRSLGVCGIPRNLNLFLFSRLSTCTAFLEGFLRAF